MEFTGERFMPEFPSDWGSEHIHRYLLASELCVGKEVLDVASGEGYGSALLSKSARYVTGIDISEEAVAFAREKYPIENLVYSQGTATALPFEDQSFDVVVSFETIEHLTEQEAMMDELSRVLRPDGLLIISSPDKEEYTDIPQHKNEYHVKELYRQEFENLIQTRFSHYVLYGQRLDYGSLIIGESDAPFFSYDLEGNQTIKTMGLSHAMFHIALASHGDLPRLPNSIRKYPLAEAELMRRKQAEMNDWKTHALGLEKVLHEREATLRAREEELGATGEQLTGTRILLGEVEDRLVVREKQLNEVVDRLTAREKQLGEVGEELTTVRLKLQSVYESPWWRLTSPLRRIFSLFHF